MTRVVMGLLAAAWLAGTAWSAELNLAPLEAMPPQVRAAAREVQEAYRYAVANPARLKAIPCYCGCEELRHQSNYECYVEEVRADGGIVFSDHGLG